MLIAYDRCLKVLCHMAKYPNMTVSWLCRAKSDTVHSMQHGRRSRKILEKAIAMPYAFLRLEGNVPKTRLFVKGTEAIVEYRVADRPYVEVNSSTQRAPDGVEKLDGDKC